MREALAEAAAVLVPLLLAALAEILRRHLGIAGTTNDAKAINEAASRAGASVYARAVAEAVPLSDARRMDMLMSEEARYALARIIGPIERQRVKTDDFMNMVRGDFAHAIVADPTIAGPSAGQPEQSS